MKLQLQSDQKKKTDIKYYSNKSQSLERVRKEQLPPLKPRSISGGNNLSKSPKLQQQHRSIKLATEINTCYDNAEHDLEHIPLPDIPNIDTTPVNKKTPQKQQREHIVPMDVKTAHSMKPNVSDITRCWCKKLLDNACIYSSSVDIQDHTIAYIPAAITIEPTKMQHCTSSQDLEEVEKPIKVYTDGEFIYERKQQAVGKGKQFDITSLTNKYDELQHSITAHLRQIDAYMSNAKQALNHCLAVDFDNGIISNTRSEYGVAFWQKALPHAPSEDILAMKTPLQTLLKQIAHKSSRKSNCSETLAQVPAHRADCAQNTENMPVIEAALAELATILQTEKNLELRHTPELHFIELKTVPKLQNPAQYVLIDEELDQVKRSVKSIQTKLRHVVDAVPNYEQLLADVRSDLKKSTVCNVEVIDKIGLKNSNHHQTASEVFQHQSVNSGREEKPECIISNITGTGDISSSSIQTIQLNPRLSFASDNFDTFKATYEIPSIYSLNRQISWIAAKADQELNKEMQSCIKVDNSTYPKKDLVSQKNCPPILSTIDKKYIVEEASPLGTLDTNKSLLPKPPVRKYPGALVGPYSPESAASSLDLNVVGNFLTDSIMSGFTQPPSPVSPIIDGLNVGLLVHSPTLSPPAPLLPHSLPGNN